MADVMSFGASVLGSSITWGPFSADYATYMPEDTKKWKLFTWTFLGISCLEVTNLGVITGQVFVMWLGAGLMTATINNQAFADAYAVSGIGGLMDQSFQGYGSAAYGFGKFVQLGLVFSTVALTIPCLYSAALSMQNCGMWAVKVPRFVWSTIAFIVFTVAAIAGREHFATVLGKLSLLPHILVSHFEKFLISGSRRGARSFCWNISFSVEKTGTTWICGGHKRGCRMELPVFPLSGAR
jgi:purine-cytosine permease-like protein